MERDDVERLVRLEVGLEEVRNDINEHRDESRKRDSDLRELIEKIGTKIDDSKFQWPSLFSVENVRLVGYVVLSLAGLAAAAKALL